MQVGSGMSRRREVLADTAAGPTTSRAIVEHRDRLAKFGVANLVAARRLKDQRLVVVNLASGMRTVSLRCDRGCSGLFCLSSGNEAVGAMRSWLSGARTARLELLRPATSLQRGSWLRLCRFGALLRTCVQSHCGVGNCLRIEPGGLSGEVGVGYSHRGRPRSELFLCGCPLR